MLTIADNWGEGVRQMRIITDREGMGVKQVLTINYKGEWQAAYAIRSPLSKPLKH